MSRRLVLDFTVTPWNEAFRNYHIITCRMTTKSSSIISNNIYVVQKLTFSCSENQNVIRLYNLGSALLLWDPVVLHHSLWVNKYSQTFSWYILIITVLISVAIMWRCVHSCLVVVGGWRIWSLSLAHFWLNLLLELFSVHNLSLRLLVFRWDYLFNLLIICNLSLNRLWNPCLNLAL